MILTQVGKRELARRTRDLRVAWSAAIRTATRIARDSGSGELGTAGSADYSYEGASHDKEEQRTQRKEQRQHATTTDTSGIPLVEAPILRFLWGLHGSTAAGVTLETAWASAGVEPSELKYVGASLRSTLVGGANRRIWGSQVRYQPCCVGTLPMGYGREKITMERADVQGDATFITWKSRERKGRCTGALAGLHSCLNTWKK